MQTEGPDPSSYRLARWCFLRLLGTVYLIAFVSLWVQIDGLVGSDGILPVEDFLPRVRESLGAEGYFRVPTLCWISQADAFLHGLCAIGVLFSVVLIVGFLPIPVLFVLWAVYLSLSVAGQTFLSFQWDTLLLETGFLAMFLAPTDALPRSPWSRPPPPRGGSWLLRFLLFKLMFLSGIVKLISMDDTWWDLTALDYHYFTQPLPLWTLWYAHHLPSWFHKLSVIVMFTIELAAPFLVFFSRRPRLVGCAALVLLQLAIAATGNYGFFNLLTVVLCVPLIDDATLGRLLPGHVRVEMASGGSGRNWYVAE